MFIAFIGFKADFTSLVLDRYGHKQVKFFKSRPSVEQLIKIYNLELPEEGTRDHSIYMRALSDMVKGNLGYYYGETFLMKEITFEEESVEHAC